MSADEKPQQGSAAEAVDQAEPATVSPSVGEDGSQSIPVSTDENGAGWGVVGLYQENVSAVDVQQSGQPAKGKVELAPGGEGLTRINVTGAPANAVVVLHVTPKT